MNFNQRIESKLSERKANALFRQRKVLSSAQSQVINLQNNKQDYINFCSNDYLGLANHPKIIEAFTKAANTYGVGSGASHLVIGHHQEHQKLEEELADFLGFERALVFGSGFSANLGVLNTILEKTDGVFEDKLNHASLLDGGLTSGAKFQRYLHKDVASLESKLHKAEVDNSLIVSDAVFSMDGDSADIAQLVKAKNNNQNNTWLMLDDAHGFGALGKTGQGSLEAQKIKAKDVDIYIATFGKALGTSGAFIAGSSTLIEYLIQYCRHYIYTTAMPPAIAAATRAALNLVKEETWRREKLQKLSRHFQQGAKQLSLPIQFSETAIHPVILGEADQALTWSERLAEKGFLISAIRPPTVAKGSARLRITLSAEHSEQQVDALLECLGELNKTKPLTEQQ